MYSLVRSIETDPRRLVEIEHPLVVVGHRARAVGVRAMERSDGEGRPGWPREGAFDFADVTERIGEIHRLTDQLDDVVDRVEPRGDREDLLELERRQHSRVGPHRLLAKTVLAHALLQRAQRSIVGVEAEVSASWN